MCNIIFRSASAQTFRRSSEMSSTPWRTAERRPTSSTPRSVIVLRSRVARSGVPTSCDNGSRALDLARAELERVRGMA